MKKILIIIICTLTIFISSGCRPNKISINELIGDFLQIDEGSLQILDDDGGTQIATTRYYIVRVYLESLFTNISMKRIYSTKKLANYNAIITVINDSNTLKICFFKDGKIYIEKNDDKYISEIEEVEFETFFKMINAKELLLNFYAPPGGMVCCSHELYYSDNPYSSKHSLSHYVYMNKIAEKVHSLDYPLLLLPNDSYEDDEERIRINYMLYEDWIMQKEDRIFTLSTKYVYMLLKKAESSIKDINGNLYYYCNSYDSYNLYEQTESLYKLGLERDNQVNDEIDKLWDEYKNDN